MNSHPEKNHYPVFLFGLVTGAALGGGLAMDFAPTIGSKIRKRVAASAKDLSDAASGYYEQVSTRVVDAVEELTSRGQTARDAAAGVVVRGAHEVGRFADQVAKEAGKH